jgi:protein-S-isoprenylcysteine O-methyltransferase Ste14
MFGAGDARPSVCRFLALLPSAESGYHEGKPSKLRTPNWRRESGPVMVVNTMIWIAIVVVHATVTVIIPYLLLLANFQFSFMPLGLARWFGLLPLVLGALMIVCSVRDLTVAGKGTPAPFAPPRQFVGKGLYRFMRNPLYAGDLLVLMGEVLLFESVILSVYALLLLGVFHLFVVLYEEPTLTRKFGEPYERYRRAVPRWLPGRAWIT